MSEDNHTGLPVSDQPQRRNFAAAIVELKRIALDEGQRPEDHATVARYLDRLERQRKDPEFAAQLEHYPASTLRSFIAEVDQAEESEARESQRAARLKRELGKRNNTAVHRW